MLIRFNVTNFLSFNQETEFNMLASDSLKTHSGHKYPLNKKEGRKIVHVLKSSVIYGANGAGKSNLIKALRALQRLVEEGKVPTKATTQKFRLCEKNKELPTVFEIEFEINKTIYTYGVSFDSNLVLEEWLYETGKKEPRKIFARTYSAESKKSKIEVEKSYLKNAENKLLISLMEKNLLQNNELLLSKNENLKIQELDDVLYWFSEKLAIVFPSSKPQQMNLLYESEDFKEFSESLLNSFDVGVSCFSFEKEDLTDFINTTKLITSEEYEEMKRELDEGRIFSYIDELESAIAKKEGDKYVVIRAVTNRIGEDNKTYTFNIREESDGTRRLIDFFGMLYASLHGDVTYIIDEIDRSLHPSLLHKLISKVMADDTMKGQLIFSTHESSLLDTKIFRTDEIWFAEKNRELQTTELYTLNEFKPRNDLDIEKGYLNGRFGAIPFLTKLDELNWNCDGIQS